MQNKDSHRDLGKHKSDSDDDNMKESHKESFLTIIETLAKFDIIIKDQCIYNYKAKLLPWNIWNDFISCLAEFVEGHLKEHISESTYYSVISD